MEINLTGARVNVFPRSARKCDAVSYRSGLMLPWHSLARPLPWRRFYSSARALIFRVVDI
ncbi:hypothetical protein SeGA_0013, partial [Salmonella enterica subsp. enterica serovar Gaminara str. A4-567]